MSVKDFIRHNYRHFNAAVVVDASEAYIAHVARGGKMFMTLAGAMSTAELGLSLAEMIRQDKVHGICTTGANLEEDIFNLVAHNHYERVPHYRNLSTAEEVALRDRGMNRVTDTCIPEEEAMRRIERQVLKLWQKADQEKQRYFPYEYMYQLICGGHIKEFYEIDPKDSWVVAACEKKLPIFTPGWEDSTLGNIFVANVIRGEVSNFQVVKSGVEQMAALIDWYRKNSSSDSIGFFQVAGGIAGDFPICVVPLITQDLREKCRLWGYFCQISDSTTSYGSYSGAVPNEKITWGKLEAATPRFIIESDASIVAPLMFAYILGHLGPPGVSMENREIARILRETAQLLEIDGAMIGRFRSYERAAELLDRLHESIEELALDREKLTALPGIGEGMADHIEEILKTGDYVLRKKLLKKYPGTLLDLLTLQSLGPKKVAFLWKTFKAGTVEQVEKLARDGSLRDLAGFGERSEQNILKAVEVFKKSAGRFHIDVAEEAAEKLVSYIRATGKPVESVTPAGSLRRGKETIGDLDLLVTLSPGKHTPKAVEAISEHILRFPEIDQTLAHGENKVSFVLKTGLQVDVRLLDVESFGAALLYFTGSKEHNVSLRGRANKMGYTLNEYALATLKGERPVASATEMGIYAKLGLDYIPPEMRENTGEIDAAAEHRLPQLIELGDIRGDMQMHTTASDGQNSIEEMALAARNLGYQYIALTDHSKAVTVANGLDEKRTLEQIKKIRAANAKEPGIRVLASSEVDVLKDGRLDLDSEVLAQLDVVLVSIHSYMNLERAEMTDRILAAIENPYTQIVGHPTGRLVLRRDAYAYDMERILDAARKHGVVMECNASPERLDLKDAHLRMAKERGVKIVISTDAHTTRGLLVMRYGVQMARRGWLEKNDVINTLPADKILATLRPKPGAASPVRHLAAVSSAREKVKSRKST